MGTLEKDLPKIVNRTLHEEDKVTKQLVNTLLRQVIANQNKSSKEQIIKRALDDEIDKCYSVGMIDEESILGGK